MQKIKTLAIALVAIILLGAVSASAQTLPGQQAAIPNAEDIPINFSISWHGILIVGSLIVGFVIGWLVRGARVNRNIGAAALVLFLTPALANAQDRMVPVNTPGASAATTPDETPRKPLPPAQPNRNEKPNVKPTPPPAPVEKGILDENAAVVNGKFYTVREALGYNLVHGASMNTKLNWLLGIGLLNLAGLIWMLATLRPAQPAAAIPATPAPQANTGGGPRTITALILALLIPTFAFAQAPTAKVTAITPDAWVEGTDKVVTITCSPSCGAVDTLEFTSGITASDVKEAGRNKVTAKLTLTTPGPYSFNLVRKDGTKLASGNVTFTVFTATEARLVEYLQGKINARQSGTDRTARADAKKALDQVATLRDMHTTLNAYFEGTQRDVAAIKADYVSRTNLGAEVLNTEVAKTGDGQVVTMRAALEALSNNAKALEGRVGTVETRVGYVEAATKATGDVVDALSQTAKTGGVFNRKPAVSGDLRQAMLEALKPIPGKVANGGGQ